MVSWNYDADHITPIGPGAREGIAAKLGGLGCKKVFVRIDGEHIEASWDTPEDADLNTLLFQCGAAICAAVSPDGSNMAWRFKTENEYVRNETVIKKWPE